MRLSSDFHLPEPTTARGACAPGRAAAPRHMQKNVYQVKFPIVKWPWSVLIARDFSDMRVNWTLANRRSDPAPMIHAADIKSSPPYELGSIDPNDDPSIVNQIKTEPQTRKEKKNTHTN